MISLYDNLGKITESEFRDIITKTELLHKKSRGTSKLRITILDGSYLDVWLSPTGKYSYHWEQRAQRGRIDRFDNAPDHPHLKSFPHHRHSGDEKTVEESPLPEDPASALRFVLLFIRERLSTENQE